MSPQSVRFQWNKKKRRAAELLAEGYMTKEVAAEVEVDPRSVRRWKADSAFVEYVDRLTLSSGVAISAERLRIIKRVVRDKTDGDEIQTKKDLLEWLKLAHDETSQAGNVFQLNVVGFDQALTKIYGSSSSE